MRTVRALSLRTRGASAKFATVFELIIAVGETEDAAEEGLKIITAMLFVGLIFASVVILGELIHRFRHRQRRDAGADDVNTWTTSR